MWCDSCESSHSFQVSCFKNSCFQRTNQYTYQRTNQRTNQRTRKHTRSLYGRAVLIIIKANSSGK